MECISYSQLQSLSKSNPFSWEKDFTGQVQPDSLSSFPFASPVPVQSISPILNKTKENLQHNPFPIKLHGMLEDAENEGFDHTWCCNGKAFKVHDPQRLVQVVLPRYFTQTRYKSFQRQINVYGFTRIARGEKKGLCYHKNFVRDDPSLCVSMQRIKMRPHTMGADEILLSQELALAEARSDSPPSLVSSDEVSSDEDIDESEPCVKLCELFEEKTFFPVPFDSRLFLSESEDFEASDLSGLQEVSPRRAPSNVRDNSFPWKLYDMLEEVEKNGNSDIISWEHGGRALRVHKPKEFATQILPDYFIQTKKLESFQRQLNLYGYIRVAKGPHKGMYMHKYFVRGQRSLCRYITRQK